MIINTYKPHVFREDLPLGPGIAFEKIGNRFKPKSMHESGHRTSLAALEWLEYENREYLNWTIPTRIQHAFNGRGEKKIGNYHLDGFVEWETSDGHVWIGYEFMGCRFHQCPFNCGTTCLQTDEEYEKEQDRIAFLHRNLTRLVVIYECEWVKLKEKLREQEKKLKRKILTSTISQFLSQPSVKEDEILNAVAEGTFYGLICLDITTPPDVIEKYKQLNFPFIFHDVAVSENLLNPETLAMATERKVKFPVTAKTLTWNSTGFIGCTPLLQFYLSLGMKLGNVRWAIQYQKGAPFSEFVNSLVNVRIAAIESNNGSLADRAKFVLNSAVARDKN